VAAVPRIDIVSFFEGKGLSPTAAAGIAGNTMQESSDNPETPGGGLFQDIGSRAPSGTGTAAHQLEAAWGELQRSPGTLSKLQAAKTPQEAARVFSEDFERPGTPDLPNREKYAAEAYEEGRLRRIGKGEVLQQPAAGVLTGSGIEGAEEDAEGAEKSAVGAITAVPAFLEALTSPSTWLRLAEGVGGIVLFMVGLKTLTRGSAFGSGGAASGPASSALGGVGSGARSGASAARGAPESVRRAARAAKKAAKATP
jgi:Phage tail lysozyme